MRKNLFRGFVLCLVFAVTAIALAGCGSSGQPAATTAPTEAPVVTEAPAVEETPVEETPAEEAAAAWPDDAAIAYCPVFDADAPDKVAKQDKMYVLTFNGRELDDYNAYADKLGADANITVLNNYSTRGNAYMLNAEQKDNASMTIRVTYTVATKILQISVNHTA